VKTTANSTATTRVELLAIYAEVDALLAPYSCAASGECCDFANTGREPYPTAVELAEVERAMRAASVSVGRKRRLPVARGRTEASRVCPLLADEGRCRIYASRPFGCRTFFCERITPEGSKLPRKELQDLSRRIADLASRFAREEERRGAPCDPRPRPLTNALK
jgi:Fe-S-cluster containining protein